MINTTLKSEDFFSNDLTAFRNSKVINIFNLFSDYNELVAKKIEFCMEFFAENNFSESERLHSEIMLAVRNEKNSIPEKIQELLYDLFIFYMTENLNLRAHEIMEVLPVSDLKVKALTAYGLKIKKEVNSSFADIYFSKAKKLIDQSDTIKSNIINTKNINEKHIVF